MTTSIELYVPSSNSSFFSVIETLSYHSECKAGDVLVMEKKVPGQYYGKTMFFLSADKELVIRMDGEEIYSKKKQKLAPGEMESITLKKELFENAKKLSLCLEVE